MIKSSLKRALTVSAVVILCLSVTGEALAQAFPGFGGAGGGAAGRARTTRQYPSAGAIGDAVVSVDPETRRIIVITDEETSDYVSQVITNLDRPRPQVLINVVFLEVTYRNGSDIGVEGSFHKNLNGPTANIVQQFRGLPGITSGEGIFNVIASDYTVTLRAIAEAGKLEILSRPSVLARNNQQATIIVGQQVPLITNVRYDTFGNQINAITYQDVGIILRVTPFITSANTIEMIVSPEISNLSDQTVQVATGTNTVGAPVINRRSADTVVVAPDGKTVVIGGLMQNNKTETTSKIPLLGDLPLMGALFRRTVKADTKTELMIFLTPRIVSTETQIATLTRDQQSMLQRAFSEQELNKFLEGVPTRDTPTAVETPGTSAPNNGW